MKTLLALVLAAGTVSCSTTSPAPAYPGAVQEAQDAAYELLRQGGTSIGIGLVARDRAIWTGGFGTADLATSAPVTRDTMFPIGSVSKMFAAVAVMQLVDRGLVDLDTPVVQYLPSFRMADPRYRDITVRMLLNHTSGIPGTMYLSSETSVAAPGYARTVLAALADQRLKAAPGSMAVYCNDGFTLVDPLVAAVSGKSYPAYVQQEILAPIGMTHTSFPVGPYAAGSYAKAYRAGVEQPQEYVNVDAAGGLYSTAADMGAFARMFLNGGLAGSTRVLSTRAVAAMAVDQTVGTFNPVPWKGVTYGLGWDSVVQPGLAQAGIAGWTKNGGTVFYGAQILVAPDEGLATVVMAPAGAGYSPIAIAERVLIRALVESGRVASFPSPLPPVAAPAITPPAGLAASMAGLYANYAHLFQLRAEPDGSLTLLTLRADGFSPTNTGLRYRSDGWFTADAAPLFSMRVVSGGGEEYLAVRSASGDMAYLDQSALAQRVRARGAPVGSAWTARLGQKRWVVVNEHPDSFSLSGGDDPRFALAAVPGLDGVLVATPALPPMGMGWQTQVLDASGSDVKAAMMLVIPGYYGSDLDDLDVVIRGGEEWLRWGAYLHRPLETVPVLPLGGTSTVTIGPEGFGEWRAVPLGAAARTVSISGARAWRLYDASFRSVASGGAAGQAVLPSGTGSGYLLLYGVAGTSPGVSVQ